MTITLDLPLEIERRLRERGNGDLSRKVLEAVAFEGYHRGTLSSDQVSQLLNLSPSDAEAFLSKHEPDSLFDEDKISNAFDFIRKNFESSSDAKGMEPFKKNEKLADSLVDLARRVKKDLSDSALLSVERDEDTETNEIGVFIRISSSMNVEEAGAYLEKLYDEWYFNLDKKCQSEIIFTVESGRI